MLPLRSTFASAATFAAEIKQRTVSKETTMKVDEGHGGGQHLKSDGATCGQLQHEEEYFALYRRERRQKRKASVEKPRK